MNHDGEVSKANNIDQTMTTFRAALARMDANPAQAARIRNLANTTDAQMAAEAEPETLRRPSTLAWFAAHTEGPAASAKDWAGTDAARETSVHPAMRAASADRELTVGVLKDGFAEGRLTQDEYNDRMGRAYAARTHGELIALTADVQAKAARIEETSGRARPWWLPRDWLALGVLGAVLAAVALVAAFSSPVTVIFLVGALLGVLMGGALCVRYFRREVAAIGPKLKRMQLQLDNIETELNLAIATRHAELSADPSDLLRQGPQRHEPRPLWR